MVLIQFPDENCGEVEVSVGETVRSLKAAIVRSYDRSHITSLLTFNDTPLNDDYTLQHYGIGENDVIKAQMQIYVYFLERKGFMLDVEPLMSILEVKIMIESTTQDSMTNLRLIHNGNSLDDGMNLQQCGITDNTNIFVVVHDSDVASPAEGCIQIYIKTPENTIQTLDVKLSNTISEVKRKLIEKCSSYTWDRMRLSYGEEYLDNEKTLMDCKISNECLLHLIMREGGESSFNGLGDAAFMGFAGGNNSGGGSYESTLRPSSAASAASSNSNQITLFLMDNLTGNVTEFKVNKEAPLSDLFLAYCKNENVLPNILEFAYGDIEVPAQCAFPPDVLGISDNDTIIVSRTIPDAAAAAAGNVDLTHNNTRDDDRSTLLLQDPLGSQSQFTIDKNNTRLSEVFHAYANRFGILGMHAAAQFCFTSEELGELPYDSDIAPADIGIENGAVIHVSSGMPGSMSEQGQMFQQMNEASPPMVQSVQEPAPSREIDLTRGYSDDIITVTLKEPGRDSGFEFKINSRMTLLIFVFEAYCARRGAPLSSLQFVLGARRLTINHDRTELDGGETALNVGLDDGDIIFVLNRKPKISGRSLAKGDKFDMWFVNLAIETDKEFFRFDSGIPFHCVLTAYAEKRRKVDLKSLRFLYGDRIIRADSNETALDLGLQDEAIVHVLEKGQILDEPILTDNAAVTVYETDPDSDRIFEPIVQILEVEKDTVTISDGECSLVMHCENLGLTEESRYAIVQVNDFRVVMSDGTKVFHLLDIDEVAPNPGTAISHIDSIIILNAANDVFRAKEILARQIIADFVWRCNEMGKVRAANARKIIGDSVWRVIALRRRTRLKFSVMMVQKLHRGRLARKIYFEPVQQRLEEFRRFNSIWKSAIGQVLTEPAQSTSSLSGWALVREKIDVKKIEHLDDDDFVQTDRMLSQALSGALQDNEETDSSSDDDEDGTGVGPQDDEMKKEEVLSVAVDWSKFQISSHVVKFIKNGDMLYRDIFVRRMKQLAKGERSHKLQKPLKGCESIIYESYMDNSKGGFRLLWTQERETIVVWFIAKHKSVSRLAKLIDDAKRRTARQHIPENFISELNTDPTVQTKTSNNNGVMLDPLGNVPAKLYDVNFDSIDTISDKSWTPSMHLTEEERDVVEAKGTVLLLGRSGTGKTICISNRIEYDRQRLSHQKGFTQLFISRSSRLCRYVEGSVGKNEQSTFTTFDRLLHKLDSTLFEKGETNFSQRQHVDFSRFKGEFYANCNGKDDPSALVTWKCIRTFLKGSIEAFQNATGVLSEEYFVSGKLGKNRCKIRADLLGVIYAIFIQYQAWLQSQNLWDDCDHIRALLKKVEHSKQDASPLYDQIRRSKIYVDEVQDYLQIEILLFFYISGGPGALFLAGDPAQSVVEGTDFRFDEIRSVGHFVAGDRRDLIPEKPRIVNVNFRSHAGILNCAGGFLDLLFDHFSSSAKQLKKDRGLFRGARPGVFHKVQVEQLTTLLQENMQGAVVLTHDDIASRWREILGYDLVYGVREAKGLEFKTCIILDFFCEIPDSLQKPWRDMLFNRVSDNFEQYPLIETYLKLIYTATTRCIEQLFIAETKSSVAGDATVRWLTTTMKKEDGNGASFATINSVGDLESMSMTNDEFCVVGIDNAELAGSPDIELDQTISYLDRAIYCFKKASSPELVVKAQTHKQSVHLRSKLASLSDNDDKNQIEEEAAPVIEKLLSENLLLECTSLLNALIPLLTNYTQNKLDEEITSKIGSGSM